MGALPAICGAVAEWSKALAWKVSIRQNRIEGSNPSRSAKPLFRVLTDFGIGSDHRIAWMVAICLLRQRNDCGGKIDEVDLGRAGGSAYVGYSKRHISRHGAKQ